tara:strand:- start:391 stop:1134 length:744 start_codon:yes stop_codon:yes gene_type:complete
MKVSFFEEFPSKKTLGKLKLISWPSTIYVAAKSLEEFEKITKRYKRRNINFAYWPILEKKEGYWLSPFSSNKAVKRVIEETKKSKVKIMWDAELPFRHPWLFLRLDNFVRNRSKIKKFFRNNGKNILTSEYPIKNSFMGLILRSFGVNYSPKKYGNKKIIMYYTSMHKYVRRIFLENITKLHQNYGENLQVGLGTIATGILGNEPILSAKNLNRDLWQMEDIGVKEVVIFRLGGLNKRYVNVIQRYV